MAKNPDKPNTSKASGNNTQGQTWHGGGRQLRQDATLDGDDPHFEDRTQKGSAPEDGSHSPKAPDQG